jgi:hypothetical protein
LIDFPAVSGGLGFQNIVAPGTAVNGRQITLIWANPFPASGAYLGFANANLTGGNLLFPIGLFYMYSPYPSATFIYVSDISPGYWVLVSTTGAFP